MVLFENIFRRRTRSLLTVLGVSLGIATVVSLIAVAYGFRAQLNRFFSTGDAHLIVTQKGASDPMFSYLPASMASDLAAVEGVEAVHPFLLALQQIPSQPIFFFYGVTPGSPFLSQLTLLRGRWLFEDGRGDAICLGEAAAHHLGRDVGSVLKLGRREFRVVGVYRSSIGVIGSAAVLPFATAQQVAGLEGMMSCALLTLSSAGDAGVQAAERAVERSSERLEATVPAGLASSFQRWELVDQLVSALAVLAMIVGGIGVMNTMLMSVFERTREIGILQAVGWSKSRILLGLLLESLILCGVAGPFGLLLGVAAVEIVGAAGNLTWIDGHYSVPLFLGALAIATGMGILGCVYPALRAVRISPVEALRYE